MQDRNIRSGNLSLCFLLFMMTMTNAECVEPSLEQGLVNENHDTAETINDHSKPKGSVLETGIKSVLIINGMRNKFHETTEMICELYSANSRHECDAIAISRKITDGVQEAADIISIPSTSVVLALNQNDNKTILLSVSPEENIAPGYVSTDDFDLYSSNVSGTAVTTPSIIESSPVSVAETDPISDIYKKIIAGDLPSQKRLYGAIEIILKIKSYESITDHVLQDKLIKKAGVNFVGHLVVDAYIEVILEEFENREVFSSGCSLGIFCDKVVFKSFLTTAKNMLVLDLKSQLVDQVFIIAESWNETADALDALPCPLALSFDERENLKSLYRLKKLAGSPMPEGCNKYCKGNSNQDVKLSTQLNLSARGAGKYVQQGGCLSVDIPVGADLTLEATANIQSTESDQIPNSLIDTYNEFHGDQVVWYLNRVRVGTGNTISITLQSDEWPHLIEARIEPTIMTSSTSPISPALALSYPSNYFEVLVTENDDWACRGRIGVGCKDSALKEQIASESQVIWDDRAKKYIIEGKMSVGAIKHDMCCDDHPDGFRCPGTIIEMPTFGQSDCEAAWEQAKNDVLREKLLVDIDYEILNQWDFKWTYPPDPGDSVSSVEKGWWVGLAPYGARVNQAYEYAQADKIHCKSNQVTKSKTTHTLICEDPLVAECNNYENAIAGIKDAPPCPFVDSSSYLFELHVLPLTAIATSDVVLYESIGSKRKVAIVNKGQLLSVLESRLQTVPCPLKVLTSKTAYIEWPCRPQSPRQCVQELQPGELIYFIKYIGEGANRYWSGGDLVQAPAVIVPHNPHIQKNKWLEEVIPCGMKEEYWDPIHVQWYRVKSTEGVEGWTSDVTSIDLEEKG